MIMALSVFSTPYEGHFCINNIFQKCVKVRSMLYELCALHTHKHNQMLVLGIEVDPEEAGRIVQLQCGR